MKIPVAILATLLVLTSASEFYPRPATKACNRDNCFRAALASKAAPGPSSANADCSSLMQTTVIPCPKTTTTTATVIYTTSAANGPAKRALDAPLDQRAAPPVTTAAATASTSTTTSPASVCTAAAIIKPSSVPTYASACSGTARYSSACSCNGVTTSVTTLPQQIVTATATATQDSQYQSGHFSLADGDGIAIDAAGSLELLAATSESPFIINEYGQLKQYHPPNGSSYFVYAAGTGNGPVYGANPAGVDNPVPDANKLFCTLSNYAGSEGTLTCAVGGFGGTQAQFYTCSNVEIYIASPATPAKTGCEQTTLTASLYTLLNT